MPRGVGKDFMQLLEGEQRSTRARAITLLIVGVLLFIPAFLIWPPYAGVGVHAAAWVVGIGIGLILGARQATRYEDSLRGSWNRWMDLAPACDTIPELARKVRGARQTFQVAWIAAGLTLLWSMELLLVVMAFIDYNNGWFSLPILIINGGLAGLVAGQHVRLLSWTRSFHKSLQEMVQDGEVGVWGTV